MLSFTASPECGYIIAEGVGSCSLYLRIDIRAPLQILVWGGLIPRQWLTQANWIRVAAQSAQSYIKSSRSGRGTFTACNSTLSFFQPLSFSNQPENECQSQNPNKSIFEVVAHGQYVVSHSFCGPQLIMCCLQLTRLHKQLTGRKDSDDLQ